MTVMHRLIAPGGSSPVTVNGRVYSPSAGYVDAPIFDSMVLQANGWTLLAESVADASLPSFYHGQRVGELRFDTDLGEVLVWDGAQWLDPLVGANAWWPQYTDMALQFGSRYQIGGVAKSISDLTFARASTAEIILGGSRLSFASGQPRINNGAIYLDSVGATNLISSPEDHSTGWTNAQVTVGALANLGGGTVPFYPVMETAVTNVHTHRRTITTAASAFGGYGYIAPTLGRTKFRIELTANTGNGLRFEFDLSGSGSVTTPIGTGASPATAVSYGVIQLADGVWLWYITGTWPADSHTSIQFWMYLRDATGATSYAGDIAMGAYYGPVMLNASSTVVDYTASTRAAESLSIPLTDGPWSFRVRNVSADEWRGMVTVSGGAYALTPPSGSTTITKVEGYQLDYMHDFTADADTLPGDIGTGWDCRGGYVASYPLPTNTKVHISGGKVVTDVGDVCYMTRVFSSPVHYMEQVVSWTDTGGAGIEATGAMFATADPNIISNMPHHTLSRDVTTIGQRINGGTISTLQALNFTPNPAEDGTQFPWRHSTTASGTVVEAVRNSERQTYSDASLGDAGATPVGTRAVWEIYQPDAAAGNTLSVYKVAARYRPVILAA